jgi:CRISPR-associated protein Csc1
MKLYKCRLEPHDFLFFASRDLAKIGITEKIIHSTALNYAVNYTSRVMSFSSRPDYGKDTEKFQIRTTPARPLNTVPEIGFSYNAINDLDVSTEAVGNYPTVGKYYKIDLGAIQMLKGKKNFEFTGFEFFMFSFNDLPPRRVIRLGKKDNYCMVKSEELSEIKIREAKRESPIEPSHPINPLEFEGKFADHFSISLLSLPPYLLILNCRVDAGRYLEAKNKENKRYVVFPPNDKIKDILDFYGSNRN